jgi:hypothetical protein
MDSATVSWLYYGNQVTPLQVQDLGAVGVWAEVAPGKWAAISWQGKTYMVAV